MQTTLNSSLEVKKHTKHSSDYKQSLNMYIVKINVKSESIA